MKRAWKNAIGLGCWVAGTLLTLSLTVLPAATADNYDDVVENLSKAREGTGEGLKLECSEASDKSEKRYRVVYDKVTGSISIQAKEAKEKDTAEKAE